MKAACGSTTFGWPFHLHTDLFRILNVGEMAPQTVCR
jgi:hypothetical protein